MVEKEFCYDSLEDYLVCHPDEAVSKKAVEIVSKFGLEGYNKLELKLIDNIPESIDYFRYKKYE